MKEVQERIGHASLEMTNSIYTHLSDKQKMLLQKNWLNLLIFSRRHSSAVYSKQKKGSIIYGTDESELILQSHFHFRY
ncbi:hypothetical protein [Enterococcus haemoperoxidus]|uniref:hypothetical protein n=1 Tax=Enterococcus haemoperoxidus TaxID=155618 RepID=UPI0014320D44|nr:hypothetical protein [Enterococcus haemoperoxidus]